MRARDRAAGRGHAVHPARARHRDGGRRDIQHVRREAHQRRLRHAQRRPRRHRRVGRGGRGLSRAHEAHPQETLALGPGAPGMRAAALEHAREASAQAPRPEGAPGVRHPGAARYELHVGPRRASARKAARRAHEPAVFAPVARMPRPQPAHHRPSGRARGASVLPLREHGRLRAASARGSERPDRHLHQDHAVPPGQPVASRRSAHRRSRERQGGHGAVRAARPLRREQQHRVVAALRAGRLQGDLRLSRLQGALENLLHHAPDRLRAAAHHTAGHRQLQREDGKALHRPVVHHRR